MYNLLEIVSPCCILSEGNLDSVVACFTCYKGPVSFKLTVPAPVKSFLKKIKSILMLYKRLEP